MQIVSFGDYFHERSNPVFWKKMRKYFKMSLAVNFIQRVNQFVWQGNRKYDKQDTRKYLFYPELQSFYLIFLKWRPAGSSEYSDQDLRCPFTELLDTIDYIDAQQTSIRLCSFTVWFRSLLSPYFQNIRFLTGRLHLIFFSFFLFFFFFFFFFFFYLSLLYIF